MLWTLSASAVDAPNPEKPETIPVPQRCPTNSVEPGSSMQINPACDLRTLYPTAGHIGLALAVVPDPKVPRYKRIYDLSIQAIELGMLRDGFVLDRYYLPWSASKDTGSAADTETRSKPVTLHRGTFGLMTFRCDGWRGDHCGYPGAPEQPSTVVRALYVVTDIETRGVARLSFRCAVGRIRAELRDPPPKDECPDFQASENDDPQVPLPQVSLLSFPDRLCAGASSLVILGPDFSGAVDSVAQLASGFKAPSPVQSVCLVSSAMTDSTNWKITQWSKNVAYARLAVTDWEKLRDIHALVKGFGVQRDSRDKGGLVLLSEASTFGYGVCDGSKPNLTTVALPGSKKGLEGEIADVQDLCDHARRVYFPASIADVRYGLAQQKSQHVSDLGSAFRALPQDHLPLEGGAENGSEYPESSQSELTSVSMQLSLDAVLDELRIARPTVVIVVATEVRDRLFLFEQLREKVPRAMLIDLEADTLLTYPSFLYATRGALVLASANLLQKDDQLFGCEPPKPPPPVQIRSWSSDGQGILFDAVSRLYLPPAEGRGGWKPPEPCVWSAGARRSALNVVTLNGFQTVSIPFEATTASDPLDLTPRLTLAAYISPAFCLLLAITWLVPLASQGKFLGVTTVGRLVALCSLVVLGRLAIDLGRLHGNYSVLGALVGVGSLGVWGLWSCSRQLAQSAKVESHSMRGAVLSGVPALVAFVMASLLACDLSESSNEASEMFSRTRLTLLGLNMQSGLALYVMVAVGIFTMLYLSMVIATIHATTGRNNSLLVGSATLSAKDLTLMLKRRSSLAYPWILLAILLLIFASILSDMFGFFGGVRLTVFGPSASRLALLVLGATTAGAMFMTCTCLAALRRVRAFSAHVQSEIRASRYVRNERIGVPGLWQQHTHTQLAFAATPASARLENAGHSVANLVKDPEKWAAKISEALKDGKDDTEIRYALFALFATEISVFRWSIVGAVLCAMASVLVVYLFPIEADLLLLVNLAALCLSGAVCGYGCMVFEGDELLSNVLCNRSKKVQLSTALFALIAAPFLALAVAVMVVDIPGVVDWGDGILALVHALGLHP
jgi:hypothetical protein